MLIKKLTRIFLLFTLLIVCNCSDDSSPTKQNDQGNEVSIILNDLNNRIVEIKTSPLNLSNEELKSLAHLGNSQIIGMGEASHGTKEFFEMKHRIFIKIKRCYC